MSAASTIKPSQHPGSEPRVQMDLRVFSGMHSGAEVRLPERGILMIGQADDCDLIISDAGIAPHHCVLTVVGDQVMLRTLEGHVDIEGSDWGRRNAVLEHFAIVCLGDVKLAVGPHWSERWQQLVDGVPADETDVPLAKRRQRVLLLAGLLLVLAAGVLFGGWALMHHRAPSSASADTHLAQARDIIKSMALSDVAASRDDDGSVVMRGVVDTSKQLTALQQRLADAGLAIELHVRDTAEVGATVRKIFRQHHHDVRTHVAQNNRDVKVSGHFGGGDLTGIKRDVYASSEMQQLDSDMQGKLRLGLVDLDAHAKAPPKPEPGKRITQLIVRKDMAYVITRDGSRYYPGSKLPQGGVFMTAYPDGTIVLKRDGHYMQLTHDTQFRIAEPLDSHAGSPVPAPAESLPVAAPLRAPLRAGAPSPGAVVPVSSELAGKSFHVH